MHFVNAVNTSNHKLHLRFLFGFFWMRLGCDSVMRRNETKDHLCRSVELSQFSSVAVCKKFFLSVRDGTDFYSVSLSISAFMWKLRVGAEKKERSICFIERHQFASNWTLNWVRNFLRLQSMLSSECTLLSIFQSFLYISKRIHKKTLQNNYESQAKRIN